MKRTLLLFASLLIGLTTASVNAQLERASNNQLVKSKQHRFVQPIVFV